ncbi:MAG TPA: PEP-CTERM sorting domain-containing protein [Fimbriimonadaceae bacterium]|nr:PEP-CTERM sorting domain-containing protein [Fimbriimonadaceae bacterium]
MTQVRFASFTLAACLCAGAQAFSFSDNNWSGSWSGNFAFYGLGGGGSVSVDYSTFQTGPNSLRFWLSESAWGGGARTGTCVGTRFDTDTSPFANIDYSLWYKTSSAHTFYTGLAVLQGSTWYLHRSSLVQDGNWHQLSFTGLTASSFGEWDYYNPNHLDMSSNPNFNNAPTAFGVVGQIYGTQSAAFDGELWVDGLEGQTNPVPEPASLLAVGAGLVALASRRRRR